MFGASIPRNWRIPKGRGLLAPVFTLVTLMRAGPTGRPHFFRRRKALCCERGISDGITTIASRRRQCPGSRTKASELLLAELDHRLMNTLAVVRATAAAGDCCNGQLNGYPLLGRSSAC
jgi:hypothetical protein